MSLRHLKIFVVICDHEVVTKSAEALHIAQPAVSTTLSELEKYYNALVREHLKNGTIMEISVPDANFSRTHYLLIHKNKRLNPIGKQAYDCVLKV